MLSRTGVVRRDESVLRCIQACAVDYVPGVGVDAQYYDSEAQRVKEYGLHGGSIDVYQGVGVPDQW